MEKKKKILIISAIIIAVLLIGIGGYFTYDKLSNNDTKEKENNINKPDDKDDNYNNTNENNNNQNEEIEMDNNTKQQLSTFINEKLEYTTYFDEIIDGTKITSAELIRKALENIAGDEFYVYPYKEVFASEVESYLNNYFGYGVTVEHQNIPCKSSFPGHHDNLIIFNRDTKKYQYDENHGGHGGDYIIVAANKVISATVKDSIYTVKMVKVFALQRDDSTGAPKDKLYGYYKDVGQNTKEVDTVDYCRDCYPLSHQIVTDYAQSNIDKLETKLSVYTYNFKLENAKYVFINSTIEKK